MQVERKFTCDSVLVILLAMFLSLLDDTVPPPDGEYIRYCIWADSSQAQRGDDVAADSESLRDRDLKYKKSRWMPEKGRDPWLDMYVDEVTRSILDRVSKNRASNLSKGEEQAVLDLLKDDSIVIRPADKGSGVVIMDTNNYLEGLKREVNDPSTYRPARRGTRRS